jgi:glycosyltransferase 2 family protein
MRRLFALLSTPAGLALRYAVSFLVLGLFALSIDWSNWPGLATTLDRWWLAAGVVAAGVAYPLMALRWWLLGRALGFSPSFRWSHRVTWIGVFYSSLLPSGLGGEAARAYYVVQAPPGARSAGLAAVVWDRVIALLLLFAFAAAALLLKLNTVVATPSLRVLLVLAAAGVVTGGLFIWRLQPNRWPAGLRGRVGQDRCARLQGFLDPIRGSFTVLGSAWGLTAVIWLLDFLAIAWLARSAGLALPFIEVAIAGCVAYAVSALPISIGGHGVREAGLLFVLAAFGQLPPPGITSEAAVLLALLVWAVTVFWSLIGGLVLIGRPPDPWAPPASVVRPNEL